MNSLLEKSHTIVRGMTEEQVRGVLSYPTKFRYTRTWSGNRSNLMWRSIEGGAGIQVDVEIMDGRVEVITVSNFDPPENNEATLKDGFLACDEVMHETTYAVNEDFISLGHLHEVYRAGSGASEIVYIESVEVIGGHVFLGVKPAERNGDMFEISGEITYRNLSQFVWIKRMRK